ncbi:DUF4998 domain-containing protein [Niabella yanshanensis]|uniref:DUF4998 domain-containing protein n=2 Tax=Niabella yanshanensis TaxID=577386 RepID=A0ABZ0WDI4_9BACT|nr:DUF4998 domain-containing protein [Niabella yanshanensis]WQD40770.1 DUF4998 domain-containing protein [Niabella yanshanensis]
MLVGANSCTKYDAYNQYMNGKDLVYTGKADSVRTFPGRNRVLMQWLITADPNVKSAHVYWNGGADSVVVPIKRTVGVDTIRTMISNLPEGNLNFQIITFDGNSNHSVKVNHQASVYGNTYEEALLNRLVKRAEKVESDVLISWYAPDQSALATEVTYFSAEGQTEKVLVPPDEMFTTLANYKSGSQFSMRTLYKPEPYSIDTFYSTSQVKSVIADVTSIYLKNPGFSFISSELNPGGRFGNLKDWVTNDAVKNQGGFGGFDNIPGYGTLSLEYWGTPPISNGKIYQTVNLPPGKYTFSATVQNIDFEISSSYLTAAIGNSLPDVAYFQSGLGYAKFTDNSLNGKDIGFSFTINNETEVSLGVISTMNSGTQSLRLKGFKLVFEPL